MTEDTPKDTSKDAPKEEPKEEAKDETKDRDIHINIKDKLDKLDKLNQPDLKKQFEELAEIIRAQNEKISQLEEVTSKSQQEMEQSKKQVLLDRLQQADYDPEDFKDMSLSSLEIMLQGLAKTNSRIRIPKKEPEDKEIRSGRDNVQIFDPKTRKFVNFYDYKTGKVDTE